MTRVFGLDLDGVVCNFLPDFLKAQSRYLGKEVKMEDVDCWKYYKKFGMADEDQHNHLKRFGDEHGFRRLAPRTAAISAVNRLLDSYTVYFITQRKINAAKGTYEWFAEHLPRVSTERIYFAKDKGPLAAVLNVTDFVDDKLDNVKSVSDYVPNVYWFETKSNKNEENPGFMKAKSWDHLFELANLNLDIINERS